MYVLYQRGMCAQVQDTHQLLLPLLNRIKSSHTNLGPQNISHLPTFLPLLPHLSPRYHPWHPEVKSNPTSSCISPNALQLTGASEEELTWAERGVESQGHSKDLHKKWIFFWGTACMEAFMSCSSVKYFYEGVWEQPTQYSSSTSVCASQFGNPRFRGV